MLEDLLLWLFVVFAGIAAGAGLYELRINVPRWFSPGPSAFPINQAAIHERGSGRDSTTLGPRWRLPPGSQRYGPCRSECVAKSR
jgi:hypothetical protein